jgi:hypothetical protein
VCVQEYLIEYSDYENSVSEMDCMGVDAPRGRRCITSLNVTEEAQCVAMNCSSAGEVLVAGVPCDNSARPSLLHLSLTVTSTEPMTCDKDCTNELFQTLSQ